MKTPLLFTFIMSLGLTLFGQQSATTTDGKKVFLKADGTWEYATSEKKEVTASPGDCTQWIETTVDKMTGKSTTAGKGNIIISQDGKNGISIIIMKSNSGAYILAMTAVKDGSSCIDEGSKVNILFADDSRLELTHNSDFNCKGEATIYFGGVFGKMKQFDELKSKKIAAIRVWTMKGYVEEDVPEETQVELQGTLTCISK